MTKNSVESITDSTVLEISRQEFNKLLNEVPSFSINLCRTIADWLRGELTGKIARKKLKVIGLIQTYPTTNGLTQ